MRKKAFWCVWTVNSDNTQGIVAWTVFTMRVLSSVAFWLDWEDWSDCVDVQVVPSLPRWPFLMLWYVFQLKAMVMNSCWFILPEKMLVNSLFCCTRIFSALFIIKNIVMQKIMQCCLTFPYEEFSNGSICLLIGAVHSSFKGCLKKNCRKYRLHTV